MRFNLYYIYFDFICDNNIYIYIKFLMETKEFNTLTTYTTHTKLIDILHTWTSLESK